MKTALCCGYLCCDVMVNTPAYPEENQKQFVDSLHISAGGPAANAACLLARWGVDTWLLSQSGNDHFSRKILDDLHNAGVHTDYIQQYDGPTNCAIVISNDANGSRTVLSRNSGKSIPVDPLLPAMNADALLVDGHQYNWSVALLRKHRGISVLDAGSYRHETKALLYEVSDPVVSSPFYRSLCNETAEHDGNAPIFPDFMVITDGENPVTMLRAGKETRIPVFPVTAIDTLAAGDCFHGAYLYGRLCDLSVSESITLACAASAICVTRVGGCNSLPSLDETLHFLDSSGASRITGSQSSAADRKLVDKIRLAK